MERAWPDWAGGAGSLDGGRATPTPDGWTPLEDARRASRLPALPGRLKSPNGDRAHTPHSKAMLTARRQAALIDTQATHDGPELNLCDAPELVQKLAMKGFWLEQEPLVVDGRIITALEAFIGR